jgi:hypothetical protein
MRGAFDELQFRLQRGVILQTKRDAGGRPVSTVMVEHITGDALQQLQASEQQGRELVRAWLLTQDKAEWVAAGRIELALNLPRRTARRLTELVEMRLARTHGNNNSRIPSCTEIISAGPKPY